MKVTLAELDADPHPFLARIRPVAFVPALDGWLVTGRELALEVLRDPETFTVDDPRFSTARVVGQSMLSRDGAEHQRHREPFAEPLRLDEVRARFAPVVRDEVERLIDAIEPDGRAELRRRVAGPLAARVVALLLGLEMSDTAEVLGWYDAIVSSVTGVARGEPPSAEGAAAFEELRASVEPMLAASAELSSSEVVSNAAVMMFGGIETTEGMIANLMWHLLRHVERPIDPSVIPNAVEESLRLEPAAAVVDRYATRDAVLGGATIRRGDFVEVSLAGANRDPAFFPDPDRFDPLRENARHHLAFAQGPHVCAGMHLARLEAQTVAERLLARLPDLRLDGEQGCEPRGLVFRKPARLDVLF